MTSTATRRLTVFGAMAALLPTFAPGSGERQAGAESQAITALKIIGTAEIAYASIHSHYNTLDCLERPGCGGSPVPFLNADPARVREPRGYRITLLPGPGVPGASASAMRAFAVTAVPVLPPTSPRRAFCTDDRGVIYVTVDGARPPVESGRCLDTANPLS